MLHKYIIALLIFHARVLATLRE